MEYFSCIYIFGLLNLVSSCYGWQYFTSLKDFVLTNSLPDPVVRHSEYTYGDCLTRVDKKFYGHIYKDHLEVLGKLILREWIDVPRIPTCILLRATAYEHDTLRNTAYRFQMCVPRITYCHSQNRYKYYFLEWYIPEDFVGGMNWNIYLFGPPNMEWQ